MEIISVSTLEKDLLAVVSFCVDRRNLKKSSQQQRVVAILYAHSPTDRWRSFSSAAQNSVEFLYFKKNIELEKNWKDSGDSLHFVWFRYINKSSFLTSSKIIKPETHLSIKIFISMA
jgi:hypothetical protein